jgi:hypothetical protein
LGRVTCGDGADLMLQFWLKIGGGGTKHCRKMKRRQRAHLDSMGRKRDTARRCDDVSRRRGGTREGKGRDDASRADANLTGPKNKKNPHAVNSVGTNGQ